MTIDVISQKQVYIANFLMGLNQIPIRAQAEAVPMKDKIKVSSLGIGVGYSIFLSDDVALSAMDIRDYYN